MPDGLATGAVAAAAVSAGAVIAVEPSAALIAPGRSPGAPRGGGGERCHVAELRLITAQRDPGAAARAMNVVPQSQLPSRNWDRFVGLLLSPGSPLSGAAVLPMHVSAEPALPGRKGAILAQKGTSLRASEATTIVDATLKGRLHKDYIFVSGVQYVITTVLESSYYGRCTSTAATGGIALVKAGDVFVLATFTAPALAAQAIPFLHRFTREYV